jgi:hypothetical protein
LIEGVADGCATNTELTGELVGLEALAGGEGAADDPRPQLAVHGRRELVLGDGFEHGDGQ